MLLISFVNATESNETNTAVKIDENHELFIDDTEKNLVSEIDNMDSDVLEFNQGDKIPVSIDSPVDGNLTVLIDDELYGLWCFSKSETIFIPTYNPASFYDLSVKNIDVGTHKISFIFNLNTDNDYVPIVSDEYSQLTVKFQKYDNNILNNRYKYTYVSTLNINKKEKTINISIDNQDYYIGVDYEVFMLLTDINDYYDAWKDKRYSFGTIISNNDEIIYKNDKYIGDGYHWMPQSDENGLPASISWYTFDVKGISYDVCELGVCNITVISFIDGTSDSALFNISKFCPCIDNLECIVHNSNVTFNFRYTWFFPEVWVNVDEVDKIVSPKYGEFNEHSNVGQFSVTFNDLSDGVHVLNMYAPESDFSEMFSYNFTFKINSIGHMNEAITLISTSYIDYDSISNITIVFNGGIIGVIGNSAILNGVYSTLTKSSNTNNGNREWGDEFTLIGFDGGDIGSKSSEDSTNIKAYEIQTKSVSKSIDNLLIKSCLIIILTISFMVGFVRFKKCNQ